MPTLGDSQNKFDRWYMYLNPDASKGPPTWRLSSDEDPGGSSGGDGGIDYKFLGEDPVQTEVTTTSLGEPAILTSLDLSTLDSRD